MVVSLRCKLSLMLFKRDWLYFGPWNFSQWNGCFSKCCCENVTVISNAMNCDMYFLPFYFFIHSFIYIFLLKPKLVLSIALLITVTFSQQHLEKQPFHWLKFHGPKYNQSNL
jgi:hypothetical protein